MQENKSDVEMSQTEEYLIPIPNERRRQRNSALPHPIPRRFILKQTNKSITSAVMLLLVSHHFTQSYQAIEAAHGLALMAVKLIDLRSSKQLSVIKRRCRFVLSSQSGMQ